MMEKKSWKKLFVGATAYLVVAAAAVAIIAIWPKGEEGVTAAAPATTTIENPLSHDELVAKALEAARPYIPGAATLSIIDPNIEAHGAGGAFGIKDADGADLGMVTVDNQGNLQSLLIFYEGDASRLGTVSLEEAEAIAVEFMENWGIDTSTLVLSYSYTHNVSESQREYNLTYHTQINGIPVEGAGSCAFWISSIDGQIVFFSIGGDFTPPDIESIEVNIDEKEAKSLAMEMFESDMQESTELEAYGNSGYDIIGTEIIIEEPIEFLYYQDLYGDGGITPVWRVEMSYCFKAEDDNGMEYSQQASRRIYQVDATTGEVINFAGFM